MQLSELHPKLAKVTDQFCLIRSMHHPGPISNHFDAMHNLLSGQYVERVQQGVPDDAPYIGSVVSKHLPSERNLVSNAWLIKCVGPPVFCAPNIGLVVISGPPTLPFSWVRPRIIRRCPVSSRPKFTTRSIRTGSRAATISSENWSPTPCGIIRSARIGMSCARRPSMD